MLTMYKMYYPIADIERLYVKRKVRRRGMVQFEAACKAEIINILQNNLTEITKKTSL